MHNQHMSKGLSDNGLEFDPNHPSIIEELLQVFSVSFLIKISVARAWVDQHLGRSEAFIQGCAPSALPSCLADSRVAAGTSN